MATTSTRATTAMLTSTLTATTTLSSTLTATTTLTSILTATTTISSTLTATTTIGTTSSSTSSMTITTSSSATSTATTTATSTATQIATTSSSATATAIFCSAPSDILHADHRGTCREGGIILPGGLCTARCYDGYRPTSSNLTCSAGFLAPLTFACAAEGSSEEAVQTAQEVQQAEAQANAAALDLLALASVETVDVNTSLRVEETGEGFQLAAQVVSSERLSDQEVVSVPVAMGSEIGAAVPTEAVEAAGGEVILVVAATTPPREFNSSSEPGSENAGSKQVVLAGPAVTVQFCSSSNGSVLRVSGLATPILVTVHANRSAAPEARCVYWDTYLQAWSSSGLQEIEPNIPDGPLTCATTHLTTFAALIFPKVLDQLECMNFKVVLELADLAWASADRTIVLWVLFVCVCWVLCVARAKDASVAKLQLWEDACLVTPTPASMRKPVTCNDHAELCKTISSRLCTSRPQLRSCVPTARACYQLVAVRVVHAALSLKHALSSSAVGFLVWNGRGFVTFDLTSKSEALSQVRASMHSEAMGMYDAYMARGFRTLSRRLWLTFRAAHPLVQLLHLDPQMSSVKRLKLLVDKVLGALAICAVFFASTGSVLSSRTAEACMAEALSITRIFFVGVVSSLLVKLPLSLVEYMHSRAFVDSARWGVETLKVQRRRWFLQDCSFWVAGCVYSVSLLLYLLAFLSSLHPRDGSRWILTCIFVIVRVAFLGPLCSALLLSLGAELLSLPTAEEAECLSALGFVKFEEEGVGTKVRALAERGITVADLLEFYCKLGSELMPHFDPEVSTTHDVVRQAVIPCSRTPSGGKAYAAVVSGGSPVLPNKMVTHNWGNLFSNLLAAIFADCIGERSYEHVLSWMREPDGGAELREQLRFKSHKTYWVCAFSVNQHAGICSRPPPTDSHGKSIAPCTCGVEKHFDGEECEMNKFDEMMAYLKAVRPGFSQVVAVDAGFLLFTRIWCVAELAEASRAHLPQALKIHSELSLDTHRVSVAKLDVREAQASYPEDVDRILAKISDPDTFNESLRDLLLNAETGLFAVWDNSAALLDVIEDVAHTLLIPGSFSGLIE